MTEPTTPEVEDERAEGARPRPGLALLLFVLTFASTTWVGSLYAQGKTLASGLAYSVPLLGILLAHEFGHYVAARIHRVPASLPYFIPMPLPPLGTMGAVILMRGRIARRDALLDIGAAGPLAGMCVALPVLGYGIAESPVLPLPASTGGYWQEGHSLLYEALLYALKGPFPEGHDIMLSPTAFAGWAGLLVTMINLIPSLQLDGGHVAYALLGRFYEPLSRRVRRALLPLGVLVCAGYGLPALARGASGDALWNEASAGMPWIMWWAVLAMMARLTGGNEHPPTDAGPLSPARRAVAWFTLGLFVLLFMPSWLREVVVR